MSSAAKAVQTAIYQKLTQAPAVGVVLDHIAENQALPFIRIGWAQERQADAHNKRIREVSATITIFGDDKGYAQIQTLADKVIARLDRSTLNPTGWRCVYIRYESSQYFEDSINSTRNVSVEFQLYLEQAI